MVLNVVMAYKRIHRWYVSQESILGMCPERRCRTHSCVHACMQCTQAHKGKRRARRYNMLGYDMLGCDMVGCSGVFV